MQLSPKAFILFSLLSSTLGMHTAVAMPTAALPLEPASSDGEVFHDSPRGELRAEPSASPRRASSGGSTLVKRGGVDEFAAHVRLQMTQEGFGAQIKLIELPYSWIGVTQVVRYFDNEEEQRLHSKRYGFLLGAELHPWRRAFISPFMNLQAGWERFLREHPEPSLDYYVLEAVAGLELRLSRMASVAVQWTEAYYPGMKEALYVEQKKDLKHYATAEIFFNLKWESSSF